jgi:tRNA nucleotidyltransferase (CCA-adding enzyme)
MLKILSNKINGPILEGIQISRTPEEQKVFNFILEAVQTMPSHPIVRVAGGWTRDKLLPIARPDIKSTTNPKDIDITVDSVSGIDFVNGLKSFADRKFGTAQNYVRILNAEFRTKDEQVKRIAAGQISIFGLPIDVVSLRKEIWTDPNTGEKLVRNPIVVPGKPWDDAFRRDLTINAMFYNLNENTIEDYTGGFPDLAQMKLRTPSIPAGYDGGKPDNISDDDWQQIEARRIFIDDPTRLLRVLRFFSKYSQAILDEPTKESMFDENAQKLLTNKMFDPASKGIVVEKIADEFRKIMSGDRPADAMRIMYQCGLLSNMLRLPQSFNPLHMDQRNVHHSMNLINHTLRVLKNANKLAKQYNLSPMERMLLNMASLFHDFGKLDPRTQKVKPTGEIGYSGNPNLPKGQKMSHEESSNEIWSRFSDAMRMSNQEKSSVSGIISSHMQPHDHIRNRDNAAQIAEFKDKNPLWKIIYIHAMADAMSKHEQPDMGEAREYDKTIQRIEKINLPILLNGNEIQRLLGIKPGKIIGEIMNAIRQAQYRNFGIAQVLSVDEQKTKAVEIAKSFLPQILSRERVQSIVGIEPGRPPEGRIGYIQFVRNKIRDEQIKNPLLTEEQAEQIVKNMIDSGELDVYRQV